MAQIIQADESGALVVPPGAAGDVQPGERFRVEPYGDTVILRREHAETKEAQDTITPEEWVAWLHEWIASLPPAPPLPPEALSRDTMYD